MNISVKFGSISHVLEKSLNELKLTDATLKEYLQCHDGCYSYLYDKFENKSHNNPEMCTHVLPNYYNLST